jgi:hypothetical protein
VHVAQHFEVVSTLRMIGRPMRSSGSRAQEASQASPRPRSARASPADMVGAQHEAI